MKPFAIKWMLGAFVIAALLAVAVHSATVNAFQDFIQISSPGNPSPGLSRPYYDSGTHKFACLNSDGSSCAPSGGGGGALTQGPNLDLAAPTNPTTPTWAWVNQSGASVSTRTGSIVLIGTANPGANIQARVTAAPATPYRIVATFTPVMQIAAFQHVGVLFRNAGAGTLSELGVEYAAGEPAYLISSHYNSPTSFSGSNSLAWPYIVGGNGPITLVMDDDGVHRTFWYSIDGTGTSDSAALVQLFQETSTTFLTADQVGFYVDSNSSNQPLGLVLTNWAVGIPH